MKTLIFFLIIAFVSTMTVLSGLVSKNPADIVKHDLVAIALWVFFFVIVSRQQRRKNKRRESEELFQRYLRDHYRN